MTEDTEELQQLGASSLGDWVCEFLQMGRQNLGVYESSVRLAVKAATALNGIEKRLYEEELTACFLGGIVASLPLSIMAFGHSDESRTSFGWGRYSKYGEGRFSESNKGADFALLVTFKNDISRLAIFQAKSDVSASMTKNSVCLRQAREVDGEKRYQVQVLMEYALDITRRVNPAVTGSEGLGWVHYLAQLDDGLACAPISRISREISAFLTEKGPATFEIGGDKSVDFMSVIEDVFSDEPEFWLDVGRATVSHFLADVIDLDELADLMSLVASDGGGDGWPYVPDGVTREALASFKGPEVPFSTPSPVLRPKLPTPG